MYEKVTSHCPSSHYPTIPTPTILPPTFPVIDVLDGYNEIIESEHYLLLVKRAEEINSINNLNALTTYLRNNYINQIKIPQWNVYALDDKITNNDMEGYHHRLQISGDSCYSCLRKPA